MSQWDSRLPVIDQNQPSTPGSIYLEVVVKQRNAEGTQSLMRKILDVKSHIKQEDFTIINASGQQQMNPDIIPMVIQQQYFRAKMDSGKTRTDIEKKDGNSWRPYKRRKN